MFVSDLLYSQCDLAVFAVCARLAIFSLIFIYLILCVVYKIYLNFETNKTVVLLPAVRELMGFIPLGVAKFVFYNCRIVIV